MSSTSRPIDDPRVYLASERTFLAWIRTSISLMGFGFVIARFALWTREFSFSGKRNGLRHVQVSRHGLGWHGFCWCRCFRSGGDSSPRAISAISSEACPTRPCTSSTSMILAGFWRWSGCCSPSTFSFSNREAAMQLGMIGLGRMGSNMVRRLLGHGQECVVYDVHADAAAPLVKEGAIAATTLEEFIAKLKPPRAIWLMVPAAVVDATIDKLTGLLEKGDILIDGGNSYYHDDIRRAAALKTKGIHYVDVGTSGGVWGRSAATA